MVESFFRKIFYFKCCEDIDQTLMKDKKEILINNVSSENYIIENTIQASNENQIESNIDIRIKGSNNNNQNISVDKDLNHIFSENKNSGELNDLKEQVNQFMFNAFKSNSSYNTTSTFINTNFKIQKVLTITSNINSINNATLFSATSINNILSKETIKSENIKLINTNIKNHKNFKTNHLVQRNSEIILKIYNLEGIFLHGNKKILINKFGMKNKKVKYHGFTVFGFKIENSKMNKKDLHCNVLKINKSNSFEIGQNYDVVNFENSIKSAMNPFQILNNNKNNSFGTYVDILVENTNVTQTLSKLAIKNLGKIEKECFFQFFFIFFNTGKL